MAAPTSYDAVLARFTKFVSGAPKLLETPVTIDRKTYATSAELTQPFQDWIDAAAENQERTADYHAAVAKEDEAYKVAQKIWLLCQGYARAVYGDDAVALAGLGYVPVKHTPESPETLVAAAAKAKATRAARHTLGPDQKKAITGSSPAPASPAPPVPAVNGVSSSLKA